MRKRFEQNTNDKKEDDNYDEDIFPVDNGFPGCDEQGHWKGAFLDFPLLNLITKYNRELPINLFSPITLGVLLETNHN